MIEKNEGHVRNQGHRFTLGHHHLFLQLRKKLKFVAQCYVRGVAAAGGSGAFKITRTFIVYHVL